MAGLELLYSCAANSITSPQDAVVCFVHWEIVQRGYKCLGAGDEPKHGDKKSELLPASWSSNKELYTLRYRRNDDKSNLLLKAITVDSSLIFNLMDSATDKVTDLTVNVGDYINEVNLQSFDSVYKDTEALAKSLNSSLLSALTKEGTVRKNTKEKFTETQSLPNHDDPLSLPARRPRPPHPANCMDPLNPFAVGRADLDPFSGSAGGMIMDPLRAGMPRSGFDPSSGIPGVLPPGAVPPGARFDPFGPVGRQRPGPDPDDLPMPGYDDMFM